MTDNAEKVRDQIQTMMARTHAIQNRLMQAACRGSMSDNVASEIGEHGKQLRIEAYHLGKMELNK